MKRLWIRLWAGITLTAFVPVPGPTHASVLPPPGVGARSVLLDPGPPLNGDVVVQFRSECPPERRMQLVTTFGCRVVGLDAGSGYALLRGRAGRMGDLLAVLSRRAEVLHAEPSYQLHICTGDSLYDPYEWNLFPRGMISAGAPSRFGIQASAAWSHTRGAGSIVAVVDTGVAYEDYNGFFRAPGLANTRFAPGYNFVNDTDHPNDDQGHGTHITGIMAGNLFEGGGTLGVAPEATVMPIKAMGADGSGSDFVIAQAIRWAADQGANVINLSLEYPSTGPVHSVLSDACHYAAMKDCVLTAAAGNEAAAEVGYPAYYSYCIAVGATGFDGVRAPYSNHGQRLFVMAPGGNMNQDLNHDGSPDGIVAQTFDPHRGYDSFDYLFEQGTSMASAQVAGTAALIRAADPALSALDVRRILRQTALPLGGNAGRNDDYGYGLIDALGAVEAALAQK